MRGIKLKKLALSRSACLAMVAASAEVFPKECMGSVCALSKSSWKIQAAFPYQIAKRKSAEVTSNSSFMFLKMLSHGGPWVKLGDFHSHPYTGRLVGLAPSEVDLESMEVGDIEVIVRVHRGRAKKNSWSSGSGSIRVSWGKFRFLARAFVKLDGRDKNGLPYYVVVPLVLGN
jgi:proteasome lid subunit RPN8/RPN11